MRSTFEKMADKELIQHLEELDQELNSVMMDGDPNNDSIAIFETMTLIIEELECRNLKGWWDLADEK